jgi:hypothetical protein
MYVRKYEVKGVLLVRQLYASRGDDAESRYKLYSKFKIDWVYNVALVLQDLQAIRI